jgi:hypothetical protein
LGGHIVLMGESGQFSDGVTNVSEPIRLEVSQDDIDEWRRKSVRSRKASPIQRFFFRSKPSGYQISVRTLRWTQLGVVIAFLTWVGPPYQHNPGDNKESARVATSKDERPAQVSLVYVSPAIPPNTATAPTAVIPAPPLLQTAASAVSFSGSLSVPELPKFDQGTLAALTLNHVGTIASSSPSSIEFNAINSPIATAGTVEFAKFVDAAAALNSSTITSSPGVFSTIDSPVAFSATSAPAATSAGIFGQSTATVLELLRKQGSQSISGSGAILPASVSQSTETILEMLKKQGSLPISGSGAILPASITATPNQFVAPSLSPSLISTPSESAPKRLTTLGAG